MARLKRESGSWVCTRRSGLGPPVPLNLQRVSDILDFRHGRVEDVKALFECIPVICSGWPSNARETRQSDRAGSKDHVWSLTRKCPTCTGLSSTVHITSNQVKSTMRDHTTETLLASASFHTKSSASSQGREASQRGL